MGVIVLVRFVLIAAGLAGCGQGSPPDRAVIETAAPTEEPFWPGPGWTGRIDVPSDAGADYWIGNVRTTTDGHVTFDSVRNGPSGTSYASRFVDCERRRFAYTREADTHEALLATERKGLHAADLGPLTPGSISTELSLKACSAAR